MNEEQQVLVALRKIIRAMDLYSRRLRKTVGLTAPQLLLLQAIRDRAGASISSLSAAVSLSQATVTSIIDRLESADLVIRTRSDKDRRIVHAKLTSRGEKVLESAPAALQEEFAERFAALEDWEKSSIIAALQRVATLMDADSIDASPVLHIDADIERSTSP
jgi:DNA-binding MarR family transcriptional regulator